VASAASFPAPSSGVVSLPTYPFERKRYWLSASPAVGDAGAVGLDDPIHPLIGAVIEDPDGEGVVLSGRISLQTHPWLADHAVFGVALLPGTGLLELALRAGAQVGAPCVEELTLQAPLALSEAAATQIQVVVAAADSQGTRAVSIFSRLERDAGAWTRHASGVLSPPLPIPAPEPIGAWPPSGAVPIEVDGLYERLEGLGFEYGPAFQGLTAAWRDGEELYAEVSLPEAQIGDARHFVLHPALSDAALHAVLDAGLSEQSESDELPLAFAWRGVRVISAGAHSLRLRIVPGPDGYGFTATDETGGTVAQIDCAVARPVQRHHVEAALSGAPPLHQLHWDEVGVPAVAGPMDVALLSEGEIAGLEGRQHHRDLASLSEAVASGKAPDFVIADFRFLEKGTDLAAAAREGAARALDLLQSWLLADGLEGSRLVFLTEGALSVGAEEDPDLAVAALFGIVRSAQSEHPGRFSLLDLDPVDPSREKLGDVLAAMVDEPQVAMRGGALLAPRLVRAETGAADRPVLLADTASTVLITGGTGGIGTSLARHLVVEHGARRLLLVSRHGPDAEGASALQQELQALGAEVEIVACDVSQREQLMRLLDSIPREHRLGAVIHAAGVLDDGVIDSLDAERIERAFAPKATAAWHLHELTANAGLSAFVLFSSAAGMVGAPGQGNYAAANAFLDALAQHRQVRGLPAMALAWGAWETVGGMTEGLGSADRGRLSRLGLAPIPVEQGLGLFDLAVARRESFAAPVLFEETALRSQAKAGTLPRLLHRLVRLPVPEQDESSALLRRLAIMPDSEREAFLLEVVRGHIATVLGYASVHKVETDRAFKDLGFDSLAAVELRNRLATATGLRLEPTVVFDQPTAGALAGHLLGELGLGRPSRADELTETAAQRAMESISLTAVKEIDAMDLDDLVNRTLDRRVVRNEGGGG
jgi:NAD(P)-dependent dehydrogenase (short-subunit alcohol dehydrogenase family)/acyl carrier protein